MGMMTLSSALGGTGGILFLIGMVALTVSTVVLAVRADKREARPHWVLPVMWSSLFVISMGIILWIVSIFTTPAGC